ncbi:MAG: putative selenium-dependent hydroxylase accessory protein YqeC [Candidatus Thermofonsia Clade 1 bacterium]|jgi:molybdenum cofactor cytidylyltransferase|uniref:Putative selenium-dependent hydroxylase accessory protein YqeC n=1 Tax=Candidatus Thermofonsia Clade 1 bacterium TaxID=2364210 RepID=A0A2M8PY17_9CHLR|nr:MAG: putative selenium-dependent hydroxylase accessory protein YqeC [Candidatus Thermofonsia Clade 1 bacterium]PJF42455.1 MAG: putative selenium-dependent hydroxylase accessory protein YqeC [Candidatus Thermofonsia Clade 1 bacterium]
MRLREALNVQRGEVIAFIGAGGKTSALFRLGHELAAEGWRVLATTTTRIAAEELVHVPSVVATDASGTYPRPEALSRALSQHGFTFLYHTVVNSGGVEKVVGVAPEMINKLLDNVDSDAILIEADGARRLPFKAPYAHEPVVPSATTLAVPVVGIDCVGQPLDEAHVYNPQAMIDEYGYPYGERVRWMWVASVLRNPTLGLKGIPERARIAALINKVPESGLGRNLARLIGRLALREPRLSAVLCGSVQAAEPIYEVHQRVAAVILAGGLSRRMGLPESSKVLLPWEGDKPIIRVIAERLKRMRLDDIVVVTGHVAERVRAALKEEPVRFAHNADYATGEMLSSLQVGLRALDESIAACLVVLGDQPQIDGRIVGQLMQAYAEKRGKIIAPSYKGKRGHPILIDRSLWQDLLALPHGGAPRDVINANAHQTYYVIVDTDSVLRDVDTPDDYRQARRHADLP